MIFDTHLHLNDPSYKDYHQVIKDALENNVKRMAVVGYDLESSKLAVKIANEYPFIYAIIGIHPSEANTDYKRDLLEIEKLINDRVVAIGEIGLDYHYQDTNKEKQKELFVMQLKLAKNHGLPISIHSRDACNDTFTILSEYHNCYTKGVVHCYSYSLEMAKQFIKLGLFLGIGGVVTYKNSKEIKEVVAKIDIENIVLETDAPYLSPEPFRGKLNQPKFINYVAKAISELKNLNVEEVEKITYNNACKLFGVKQ